jgi:NAD(P)-dependent dehydrogenase (short-subunit alcohol dehydrogenase family)
MAAYKKHAKVALITGASSGIGLACAEFLAGRGYQVYGGSRRAPVNPLFVSIPMDVTNDAGGPHRHRCQ